MQSTKKQFFFGGIVEDSAVELTEDVRISHVMPTDSAAIVSENLQFSPGKTFVSIQEEKNAELTQKCNGAENMLVPENISEAGKNTEIPPQSVEASAPFVVNGDLTLPVIPEVLEFGSGESDTGYLTDTLWNQSGTIYLCIDGVQTAVSGTYNQYCPYINGDSSQARSVTGCTNTADSQIIYYWLEKGYEFDFEISSSDSITVKNAGTVYASESSVYGEATISTLNTILNSGDYKTGDYVAALNAYCGWKNHSSYGSSTSTSFRLKDDYSGEYNLMVFAALDFDSHYFICGSSDYGGQYQNTDFFMTSGSYTCLTNLGYSIVRENIDYGEVVRVDVPEHSIYLDGYRYNSTSEEYEYHLNYGWGTSNLTKWYTEAEMQKESIGEIGIDITPHVTVTISSNASGYAAGSMVRGLERINHVQTDTATTVTFTSGMTEQRIDLGSTVWQVSSKVDVEFTNFSADLTAKGKYLFKSAQTLVFDGISSAIALINSSACAFSVTGPEALDLTFTGGSLYSGYTSVSADSVLTMLKNYAVSGFSALSSIASGAKYAVSASSGDDCIILTDNSVVFGDIDLGSGTNAITIEGGSLWYGDLLSAADITLQVTEDSTDAMIVIQRDALGFLAHAPSITVDCNALGNNTVELIDASGTETPSLRSLIVHVTSGTQSADLTINETSSCSFASLQLEGGILSVSGAGAPPAPVADTVKIYSSGTLVKQGGSFTGEVLAGGGNDSMFVSSGGIADSTTVNSAGYLYITSGGTATNTAVNSGGVLNAADTVIYGSGIIYNKNGGAVFNDGALTLTRTVFENFTVSSSSIYSEWCHGGAIYNKGGEADIFDASFRNNTADVYGGAIYNDSATMNISGGTFYHNTAHCGGAIWNTCGDVTISGGSFVENHDENAGGAIYNSGGLMRLYGGTFERNSGANVGGGICNQGRLILKNLSFDNNSAWWGGGAVANYGQGKMSQTLFSGNSAGTKGGALLNFQGDMSISDCIFENNYTSGSGGAIFNQENIYLSGTTFRGNQAACGGAICNLGTVELRGAVILSTATDTIYNGGILNWNLSCGTEETKNYNYAVSNWSFVANSGSLQITVDTNQAYGDYILAENAAGFADTVSVKNTEGIVLGTISVGGSLAQEGGTYSLLLTNGTLSLNYAATPVSDAVKLYSSGTLVKQGGSFTGEMLVSGGNNSMYVSNGGTAMETTVNYLGRLYVSSGGTAADTSVYFGNLDVYEGGTATNTTANFHGYLFVHSGGMAMDTTVYFGGCLTVSSGGIATDTTVYYGDLYVCGGTATDTTIDYNGRVHVRSNGTATDTTVNSGGHLYVSSGGRISGGLQIAAGAVVSAYQGAVIDFTVAEQTAPETALINDWSLISGGADAGYTITVKADQAYGSYILADGAADFANTITVKDTFDTTFVTLDVGETKEFGGASYTLAKSDGELSLIIAGKAAASAKSDLDGNGVSDVMFQYTGGDYQIGFWMNGSSTWQATGASQPDNWVLLGNYDMDANGNADQVMFGNVLGGAYIGYYKDGDTTSNGWETIGYLNNPDGIKWCNVVGNLTGNAGKNSIVWHAPELNACGIWTDSTTNWVGISGSFDANWEMQGCGDFTGDGKDEILWQYNGALYTTDINSHFASLGGWGTDWEVRAIGDFSGDGKDDIIVQSGNMVVKFADGLAEKWSSLGVMDASDWFIVGAGDYNNDQKDDLLVRQYSTGMLGYYSTGDMSQWNEMGRGVDMNWTVIA